jgi:protocatechuate 3,4-dioxygenase beta subunit
MHGYSADRRRVIFGVAALASWPWTVLAAGEKQLPATPADAEGPFYPVEIPEDSDNDLLRVMGRDAVAGGLLTYLHGRVMDREGQRIDGARVEIWQCDHAGVYHHPGDAGTPDDNFQGFGAMVTNRQGEYHFRTLRPVPYTGRTPHVHYRVTGATTTGTQRPPGPASGHSGIQNGSAGASVMSRFSPAASSCSTSKRASPAARPRVRHRASDIG